MNAPQLLDEIQERFVILLENDPDAILKILQLFTKLTNQCVCDKRAGLN